MLPVCKSTLFLGGGGGEGKRESGKAGKRESGKEGKRESGKAGKWESGKSIINHCQHTVSDFGLNEEVYVER